MKAWLNVGTVGETKSSLPHELVFIRQHAVELTEYDAHELLRGAERDYPEYRWTMVNIPGSAFFLVEGDKKEK